MVASFVVRRAYDELGGGGRGNIIVVNIGLGRGREGGTE